jgi:hypothetical protein
MLNKIQNNRDKISGHTHPVFRVERILMVGVFLRFLRNRIATSARTAPRRFINRCTQSVGAGIQRLSFVKRWMEASRDSYRRKERKMIQFDFFSKPFGTHPKKLVRQDDPDTSHASAKKVDSSKLEGMVYEAIAQHGERGCISDEIRQQFAHLPYSSVTARYKALLDKGFIEDTGERRAGNSGRPQRVMRVIK